MELQHVNVKMLVDGDLSVDLARFIEIFHQWIQQQVFTELLIDVADYRHVPDGPGIVLVGHDCDYALDHTGGRFGLRYNRKAALNGSPDSRLRQAFAACSRACELLEEEFGDGALRFSRSEFEILLNDRALAPNTAETYEQFEAHLHAFLNALGHEDYSVTRHPDPRSRVTLTLRLVAPFDLAAFAAATD